MEMKNEGTYDVHIFYTTQTLKLSRYSGRILHSYDDDDIA